MNSRQRTEQTMLSGSRGWGKQAAQRLNTKDQFKNDPLLRILEGKIAVNFRDYKPWQRTTSLARPATKEQQIKRKSASRPVSGRTTVSTGNGLGFLREESTDVAARPFTAATSTACSTICNHPWTKKPQPIDDVEEKKRQNALAVLKTYDNGVKTWKAAKTWIKSYNQSSRFLYKPHTTDDPSVQSDEGLTSEKLLENIRITEVMDSSENGIHGDVKALLQKYERFRGAMSTLNRKFNEDLVITKKRLDETMALVNKEIADLQVQLGAMDKKLMVKTEEMNILLNYKDKEYPAKALQIAKLKRQREILEATFKEELDELQAVVDAERDKFSQKNKSVQHEITTKVTEETINAMGDDVKEMALQNMIMTKEVEIHRNEVKLLERNNNKLEVEIREMLNSQALDSRAEIFPDVFQKREKCTPDMDLHLDIPTHQWLPI